ncbi:MAG: carbohydrate kinase [Culturomica sp.]|jgi:xylulokinase|nr:carbohydrate kinase [Culturomica sp.]
MYLLGYDLGSSSVKASLVDAETGEVIAGEFFPKREMAIKALNTGWAEQSPDMWWENLKLVTRSVLENSGVSASEIAAIGISYQMHGLVLLDKDLNVVRDSIIWCDSRAVAYGEKAADAIGNDKCLNRLLNLPGNFTMAKLAWVKENEPENYAKARYYMLPGDYIAMRLTGVPATTQSGLSEGISWDFTENRPAKFLYDYFGFDMDLIPSIVPTFGVQGNVTCAAAEELGLVAGIPVTYRAGDQPNNALSLNVLNPGEVAATGGTSGVVYGVNDTPKCDPDSRVNSFVHVNHSKEAARIGVLLCINGTAILNAWIRNNIAPQGISYAEMNEAAAQVPAGSDGISIIPFGNGAERVLCNDNPGCSIHGINFLRHGKSHLIRAAQEGIAFSFKYGMEIMNDMGIVTKTIRAGHANLFLSPLFRQTLADITDATIELYNTDGSVGAARGAGIGVGIYKDAAEAFGTLRKVIVVEPQKANRSALQEAYNKWYNHLKH